MARHADSGRAPFLSSLGALLAPFPGRLEYSARLALICALTILVVEIYQTPDPALTAYIAFFLVKPDRTTSVILSLVMLVLMTLILGATLLMTMAVMDVAFWRVTAMAVFSFCMLFVASGSKLKPIGGIIALIVGYGLDYEGTFQIGEIATRGLLYVWLFVGVPVGLSIAVNLLLGPAPRRLVEQELARRLRLGAPMLRRPDAQAREALAECLREGAGEVPAWLKAAGLERTSPAQDIAALKQAAQSTAVILALVEVIARDPDRLLSAPNRERLARLLDEMAAIFERRGYPTNIIFDSTAEDADPSPLSRTIIAELKSVLGCFTEIPRPEPSPEPKPKAAGGFFAPDAFTNPAHVQYALKTTAAALFCFIVYMLLDWPGIHTCFITCYIVSLGTTAETIEKLTLRIVGCLIGAGTGLAAIIFLMPNITSIGGLMAIVFLAAVVSGWVAAGSPRISYIGFQIAFAFFLCVVQGSAPAFDLTVARDRVIGIIFGNLVVSVIFTQIWPVTVAERIDPAINALLRKLASLAAAGSRTKRWALAAETQTAFGSVQQDLELLRYEPSSIRPHQTWMNRRRRIVSAVASLQGPLLVFADQGTDESDDIRRRLDRVAEEFGADWAHQGEALRSRTPAPSRNETETVVSNATWALVEAPLESLEGAVAGSLADERDQKEIYALA